MTLQTLRQWLLCGLTFCLHSTTIQANPHTEVEAFTEVSALPILMFDVENDANEAAPHDTLQTAALPLQVGVDSVGQPADTAKISQMADSLSTKTKKRTLPESNSAPTRSVPSGFRSCCRVPDKSTTASTGNCPLYMAVSWAVPTP